MALEKCLACKKRISVEATSCPNCGHPLGENWAPREGKTGCLEKVAWTTVAFTILIVILSSNAFFPRTDSSKQNRPSSSQEINISDSLSEEDVALIEKAKDVVRDELKNPESASFGPIYIGQRYGKPVVCGNVKALGLLSAVGTYDRNFHRFIVQEPYDGAFIEFKYKGPPSYALDGLVGVFKLEWQKWC